MSAITMEPIATSRYAPEGSNAIYTYSFSAQTDLRLGQLIMAICIQRAAADEQLAVNASNRMNRDARKMAATANVLEQVVSGNASWETSIDITSSGYTPTKVAADASILEFLEKEIGVTGLPASLSSEADRFKAADKIKVEVDRLNRAAEMDSVQVQSALSRRDVEYRSAASTVYGLGQAGLTTANAI